MKLMEPPEEIIVNNDSLETNNGSPEINQSAGNAPNQKAIQFSFTLRGLMLGLIIIVIIVGLLVFILFKPAKKSANTIAVNTQTLSNGTLNKLSSKLPGQSTEQLTITPDTLFNNNVSVQKDLGVNGNFTVKGSTNLLGPINSGGNMSVNGSLNVKSNSTVGGNLSVSGLLTAASLNVGSVSLSTINLSGNLNISGHLVPNGQPPSIAVNVGASNGSANISGNDSAGTITINVGSGSLVAGEMATITFHTPFATTPVVDLTPANINASYLRYFVGNGTNFFTISSSNVPSNGTGYTFNYLVEQ